MVDWDVMNRAKQIISVLPEQYFLGANLVVITAGAVHGGRGGGVADKGWGGEGSSRELFYGL